MKVTKMSMNISKTIQVKQFEPVKVDVGYEVELGPSDSIDEVSVLLENQCKDDINRIFTPILAKKAEGK